MHKDSKEIRKRYVKASYALRKIGYEVRSDFFCCSTCGHDAMVREKKATKYVFYHKQDRGTLDDYGRLYLRWEGDGVEIVKAMTDAGLKFEWKGTDLDSIIVHL